MHHDRSKHRSKHPSKHLSKSRRPTTQKNRKDVSRPTTQENRKNVPLMFFSNLLDKTVECIFSSRRGPLELILAFILAPTLALRIQVLPP